MVYFISDIHFCHQNIFEYEPIRKKYYGNYEEIIISRWNSVVTENDGVIVVGDFACGFSQWYKRFPNMKGKKKEYLTKLMSELNGKKYLIRGNHDKQSVKFYEDIGFEWVKKEIYCRHRFLDVYVSHYPKCKDSNFKKEAILYDIIIHGHTHSKKVCQEAKPFHFNVSVEQIDFTPISLNEIIDIYKQTLS